MIATLQLVAILLLCASVPWLVRRWPQIRAAVRYELEMRRVRQAQKRSGVRYPVPDVTRRIRK